MRTNDVHSPITYGRRISAVEVAGVVITETEHRPMWSLEFHDHEAPNLNFVIGGSYRERFRSREIHCLPGSVLVKPGGALHANTYGSAGSRAVIFEVRDPHAARQWAQALSEVNCFTGGLPTAYAWNIVLEARAHSHGWKLRVEELLNLLLVELAQRTVRVESGCPKWLRQIHDYLDEGTYQEGLTLAGIAQLAGVHPVYLTRAFRARFGCTVAQFVRKKRLDHAIDLLRTTSCGIAEIAVECGFYDQSHLSNLLRHTVGLTSTQLRDAP